MTTTPTASSRTCQNAYCGKPIPSERGPRAIYCSVACKDAVKSRNYAARRRGQREWVLPNPLTCANDGCGRTIPADRARHRARYCSPGCARAARSRPATERSCARVGCDHPVTGERARHRAKYCSEECARLVRRGRSSAHTRRVRALARERRERRRDRALTAHLQTVIKDADERIRQLQAGTAVIARENADLGEIAAGHEDAAHYLAKTVWHLACTYGDRIVNHERVRTYLMHYLPELRPPDYVEPEPAPDP